MGAGQFFRGMGDRIDNALISQAGQREGEARASAIADIKGRMQRNMSNEGVRRQLEDAYIPGMSADAALQLAAEAERGAVGAAGGPGNLSIEAINQAMVNDPAARYGYSALAIGGATAGGAAMTAGAQKLAQVMGLLQEADNTEVARDMPLQS